MLVTFRVGLSCEHDYREMVEAAVAKATGFEHHCTFGGSSTGARDDCILATSRHVESRLRKAAAHSCSILSVIRTFQQVELSHSRFCVAFLFQRRPNMTLALWTKPRTGSLGLKDRSTTLHVRMCILLTPDSTPSNSGVLSSRKV